MRTEERKVSFRQLIIRRNTATTVFLAAAGALLGYLCFQLARPFLTAIAWATILAVVFEPLHRRIRARVKRENLSAGLSTLLTTLLAILPLVLLGLAVAREAAQWYRQLTAAVGGSPDLATAINQMPVIGPAWHWLQEHLKQWDIELSSMGDDALQRASQLALSLAKGTITNLSALLLNLVLVTFTLFFFFRDGRLILAHLQRIVPLKPETAYQVLGQIGEIIRAAINGVVVIGLIKGLLAGLAFWALGVHSPVLWGTVAAFASVIPMVGVSLVWVPASIALWLQGSLVKAVLLAIWGVTALSLIDNLLYPILVGGQTRLHTLLVFFSALGGLAVFGFLGFVLGPIVATLAVMLIEVASEYHRAGIEEQETGRQGDGG
jgi:predicted PurR-regulated permease PerM